MRLENIKLAFFRSLKDEEPVILERVASIVGDSLLTAERLYSILDNERSRYQGEMIGAVGKSMFRFNSMSYF